jgi:hypothetical protein
LNLGPGIGIAQAGHVIPRRGVGKAASAFGLDRTTDEEPLTQRASGIGELTVFRCEDETILRPEGLLPDEVPTATLGHPIPTYDRDAETMALLTDFEDLAGTQRFVPTASGPVAIERLGESGDAAPETALLPRRDALLPPPAFQAFQATVASDDLATNCVRTSASESETAPVLPRVAESLRGPAPAPATPPLRTPLVMITEQEDNLTRIVSSPPPVPVPAPAASLAPLATPAGPGARSSSGSNPITAPRSLAFSRNSPTAITRSPDASPAARVALVASVLLLVGVTVFLVRMRSQADGRALAPPQSVPVPVPVPVPVRVPAVSPTVDAPPLTVGGGAPMLAPAAPPPASIPPPPPTMSASAGAPPRHRTHAAGARIAR